MTAMLRSSMPDILRPTAEAAQVAWASLVRANREQVALFRETAEGADFYAPVAASFRSNPDRTDDEPLNALLSLVRAGETWLDIGAGAGRFGLPIARKAGRVIAVDASPGMLAEFEASAREHGINNLQLRQGRWPLGEALHADCSLMANIGMDVEDVGAFLDAMEDASGRLCVAMMPDRQPTRVYDRLWPALHGVTRALLPSLPEFLILLIARGRRFELSLTERPPQVSASKEELVAGARRQTWIQPGTEKDRELIALIDREARPAPGGWTLNTEPTMVGIVRWAPPGR